MTEHNDATPLSVSELQIMCEDIENRMEGFDCYSVSVTFNAAEEHRCTLVFSNQLGQNRTLQIIGDCPVTGVGDGTIPARVPQRLRPTGSTVFSIDPEA